ncbi:divergent PAP2 family protein [Heliorestis convoluta]|uniref:Divergent PAP2 family protein n=1 Tax=Heliorestis convoluta TaxID=356322 RepID=A0A5Q2MVI3_9FIRM|nr:divergent PAP2 family protein [Heliorestis convoluta]QGG46204.1 divergent PAP2 family protein [Heliorestis convoluta]
MLTLIITPLLAVVLAQAIKFILESIQQGEILWFRFFEPGGMPSSHTALVVSLVTAIAYRHGIASDLFAIAVVFSSVVIFDAMGVRRSAGDHARTLNQLLNIMGFRRHPDDGPLKEQLGHSPTEVLAGALLGFIIAWLFHT